MRIVRGGQEEGDQQLGLDNTRCARVRHWNALIYMCVCVHVCVCVCARVYVCVCVSGSFAQKILLASKQQRGLDKTCVY